METIKRLQFKKKSSRHSINSNDLILFNTNLPNVEITESIRNRPIQDLSKLCAISKNQGPLIKTKFLLKYPINLLVNNKKQNEPLETDIRDSFVIDFEPFLEDESPNENQTRTKTESSSEKIKILLENDNEDYYKSIKNVYPLFKCNHYKNLSSKRKNLLINLSFNTLNGLSFLNNEIEYLSMPFDFINEKYLVDSSMFKIDAELLDKNINSLPTKIKKLENLDVQIEVQVINILKESNLIFNYINKNLSIENNVYEYLSKLQAIKSKNELFKQKNLKVSCKMILKNIKKKNLLKTIFLCRNILNTKNNINKYNLSLNSNNNDDKLTLQEENVLSKQIKKEIIALNTFKKTLPSKNLKLLVYLEQEMVTNDDKRELRYLNEFVNIVYSLNKQCLNIIPIDKTILKNESDSDNIKNYDLSTKQKLLYYTEDINEDDNLYLLSELKFNLKNKILYLLDVFNTIISEGFDMDSIFVNLLNHYKEEMFTYIKKKYLNDLFDTTNIKMENLNSLSKAYFILISNFNYLIELLQNNFAISPKLFNKIRDVIITEIKNKVTITINQISNNFFLINQISIHNLLQLKEQVSKQSRIILEIVKLDMKELFNDHENNLIFNFFTYYKEQIQIELDNEEWVPCTKISKIYQVIINDVLLTNMNQLTDDKNLKFYFYNSHITFDKIEKETDEDKTDKLLIEGEYYKQIKTNILVIEFIYESYKILYYFRKEKLNYTQSILFQMNKTLAEFIDKLRAQIKEGNGKITKSKRQITEKEYSLLNSTASFFIILLSNFISYFINEDDQTIISTFNKGIKNFNELHKFSKEACSNILEKLLNDVVKDFEKLSFRRYYVCDKDTYEAGFVIDFKKIYKIYDSSLKNAFVVEDVKKMFDKLFGNFFGKIQNIVQEKGIIENDNMIKQFRCDIKMMSDVVKMFDLIDVDKYIKILEDMSVMINPKKTVK